MMKDSRRFTLRVLMCTEDLTKNLNLRRQYVCDKESNQSSLSEFSLSAQQPSPSKKQPPHDSPREWAYPSSATLSLDHLIDTSTRTDTGSLYPYVCSISCFSAVQLSLLLRKCIYLALRFETSRVFVRELIEKHCELSFLCLPLTVQRLFPRRLTRTIHGIYGLSYNFVFTKVWNPLFNKNIKQAGLL